MRRLQKFRMLLGVFCCLRLVAPSGSEGILHSSSFSTTATSSSSSPPPPASQSSQSSQFSQDFLSQFTQVNSPNSGDRKHRDASAVLPFIGLTSKVCSDSGVYWCGAEECCRNALPAADSGADQSRSCCKNGGTCILGSFCACPPFFTGRSCEYDTRIRRCDVVPHGEWVQKGCSYCRCFYGVLHCFPHIFHEDCDDSDEEVRWYHSSAVRLTPLSCFLCLLLLLPALLVF